uniref:Odorant receptor n=1 Tax=Glyphodes pyloalis TaxID=1242752 RepID=A0A6M3GS07_GLYPY|nr:olfactory receptor [Glyphodes pyloalis]
MNSQMKREPNDYHFKPFHETYKWITRCLTLGLMYPNPDTEKIKLVILFAKIFFIGTPFSLIILIDMWNCLKTWEITEVIRHSTTLGPFQAAIFKIFIMFYWRAPSKKLLDEYNADFEGYNRLPRRYQAVVAASVRKGQKMFEGFWSTMVILVNMNFVGVAVVRTIYSFIFDETPRRYLIHDVPIPWMEPGASERTPFYEFLFVITVLFDVCILLNYTGYDGFFDLMTNHACLKMRINCMHLEDAFKMKDYDDMERGIRKYLEGQRQCYIFIALIQETFGLWMTLVIICTVIQIGSLMFINAGIGTTTHCVIFNILCVIHIFLPCKSSADMMTMSTDTASIIYGSGWEDVRSARVRRIVPYLIARAQYPERLMAMKVLPFDLECFLAIMKTSYTILTLLQSN